MKHLSPARFLFPLLFIPAIIFSCCNDDQPGKKQEAQPLFVFAVKNIDSIYYHDELKYEISSLLEQDSIQFLDTVTFPKYGYVKQQPTHRRDTLIIRHYPQGLTLKMYSDSLKDTLTLQARKAVYSSKKRTFDFNGDVRITMAKATIFTEQLTFTESNGSYSTDKPIRIVSPGKEITGDGFEMNETFTSYKIHNMKGVINLPSEETK